METLVRSIQSVNWRIFSSLCIRRPAVITPLLTPLEESVAATYAAIELERSHLSSHELRLKNEEMKLNKTLKQVASTPVSCEGTLSTARERELIWESEAEKFKPAERLTTHDRSGNLKSAWRLLDKPLILLVKFSKNSNDWTVPMLELTPNQTLRQAADLLCSSCLPEAAKCQIFGNAPSAVYVRKKRIPNQQNFNGVQTYFFNAYVNRLWHGENILLPNMVDFAWVTVTDLDKFIMNKKLLKVLNSFIFEY